LAQYVSPALGEYFLAVGVKFNSFRVLDAFALLVLRLNTNSMHFFIDLLGVATLKVPSESPEILAFIRLNIRASIDPQAGVILGRKDLLQKIEKNPLNRALRIDKLTLAALEGTLRQYLSEEDAVTRIWALKALTEPPEQVEKRARKLLATLRKASPEGFRFSLKKGYSMAGGGSLPSQEVATSLIGVHSEKMTANEVEERLRGLSVPIVARISGDEVLFDLRTIDEEEFPLIKEGFMSMAAT
ncbi:MAG TPA: hypothetical protein P5308_09605, partial [Syntrophales bacterium]|nr:hypothetical protein [Syntrophales bacterium]